MSWQMKHNQGSGEPAAKQIQLQLLGTQMPSHPAHTSFTQRNRSQAGAQSMGFPRSDDHLLAQIKQCCIPSCWHLVSLSQHGLVKEGKILNQGRFGYNPFLDHGQVLPWEGGEQEDVLLEKEYQKCD